MEEKAYRYFAKIDELGGMVEAIKMGYPQREIADAAFVYQQEVETGVRKLVGVNAFTEGGGDETPILRIDPRFEADQVQRVQAVRQRRDGERVNAALDRLVEAARDPEENLMPHLLDATRAEATEGEIVQALQTVFGTYTEAPVF
jgi:methylmalonyl-CoA mutase N-terminal domain/subunit